MKKIALIIGLFCTGLLCTSARTADEAATASSQPMSDAEIDQTFDHIFAQQQKITRMTAKVITFKKGGGIFNKPSRTWGQAYAQMPDCLLFVDRGDVDKNLPENLASTILIDGTFLWDIKPGEREGTLEAERMAIKNAGDRDINIAALLIGADVATGKQLREYYLLTGKLEDLGAAGKSYHFTLKTIPGKEKKKVKEEVEVWIRPGEVIPWKIKSIRKTPKGSNPLLQNMPASDDTSSYKITESTKEISELQTNLSNPPLTPFPAERFYFGDFMQKNPSIKVVDSHGQEIDPAQMQQELASIFSRLKQAATSTK